MKINIKNKRNLFEAVFITTFLSILFSNILVYVFESFFSPPLTKADFLGATIISGLTSSLSASIIFYQLLLASRTKTDLQNANRKLRNTQRKLRKQANTDTLTGLFNRRSFFNSMQQEISRYERHKRPFSLLLIDIDHFKKVNDTFGHSIGDVVLQSLAKTLMETTRKQDVSARTGGEEFCVLLPETRKKAAKLMAERIRQTVSESEMGTEQVNVQITISIGVAEILPKEDVDAIYNHADIALYHAKSGGRNRVELV